MESAIKPVIDTKSGDARMAAISGQAFKGARDIALPSLTLSGLERLLISALHRWSIPALRVTLGVVFLWFGALKLFGLSPVASLVKQTCWFVPFQPFVLFLSVWEIGVGLGLIFKRALRFTLALLSLHLVGTFFALLQAPSLFFSHNNPLYLTTEGEFVIKNIVLVAAGLVIAGYEVEPRDKWKRT